MNPQVFITRRLLLPERHLAKPIGQQGARAGMEGVDHTLVSKKRVFRLLPRPEDHGRVAPATRDAALHF